MAYGALHAWGTGTASRNAYVYHHMRLTPAQLCEVTWMVVTAVSAHSRGQPAGKSATWTCRHRPVRVNWRHACLRRVPDMHHMYI